MDTNGSGDMDQPSVVVEPAHFECVPHWLLFDTTVSANALRVYLVLRKFRDYETSKAWPGITKVAELLGVSPDTVRRQIRELEKVGAVCVHQRFDGNGGQTSNLYHVHFQRAFECVGPSTDATDPLAPMQGDPVADVQGNPLAPLPPKQRPISKQDPTEQDPLNKPAAFAAKAFDQFWSAYPRKKGKGAARTAYAKVVKNGTDPAVIVHGAVQFRQWCEQDRTDPQFIPHPSTWLNQERWTDERDPAPVSPADARMNGHIALIQRLWEDENGSPHPNPLELEG